MCQHHLGACDAPGGRVLPPQFLIPWVLKGDLGFAFQVMLVLLVGEFLFEKHCLKALLRKGVFSHTLLLLGFVRVGSL